MAMDLMTTGFTVCELFAALPKPESLFYCGVVPLHFQKYKTVVGGRDNEIVVATVIRRDEDLMWQGAKDLLGRAVKEAASRTRGIYVFELLAFNALKELDSFNYNELAQVLINSSLRLRPGGEMLIRYSSMYGILRKMVDESWGKISFVTPVEVLAEEPGSLYTLMGRALKRSEGVAAPVSIVVNDISAVPLYDSNCAQQQEALKKLEVKIAKIPVGVQRDFWVEGIKITSKG